MPATVTKTTGNDVYASPFIGRIDHPVHVKVDVSALTIDGTGAQVDAKGYLKPGVPLKLAGTPVTSGAVECITIEATKIVPENPTNASLAAITTDPYVACATHALVNRDVAEDNLGRAFTAAELTGFDTAGSHIKITTT